MVTRGTFLREVLADGQIVAPGSPMLYAPSAGTITLNVHAGDAVQKGVLLMTLDSPDLTARLAQEVAGLEGAHLEWERTRLDADQKMAQQAEAYTQARVDQSTAQRELERSRKAFELGSYTELQMLRAQDALDKSQAALDHAKMTFDAQPKKNNFDIQSKKSELDRQQVLVADLRRQVSELQIRSPVHGKIGQVQVADKATVAKNTPLLTVVDLSALEAEIKVIESQARDLAPGMAAEIEGDGNHWLGTVSAISPEVVDGKVVTRVRFANPTPGGLRQSQRVSVRILIDKRDNVLMIDRGSAIDQGGAGTAYVVRNGVAERRPVRLGAVGVQKVEVLSGLVEGDQVVVSGTDEFRGAERVSVAR
jgi:HlyD family secretion protein